MAGAELISGLESCKEKPKMKRLKKDEAQKAQHGNTWQQFTIYFFSKSAFEVLRLFQCYKLHL